MKILMKCQSESCVDVCEMEWYKCAKQVLQRNSINPYIFGDVMMDLLARGRDNFCNVMIVSPANCGISVKATRNHLPGIY